MKRRLLRLLNVLFPWRELVRLRYALSRITHEAEVQTIEIERLTSMVREVEDRNDKLLVEYRENTHQLRMQGQKISDMSQKIVDLTERESHALHELTTSVKQMANFQGYMRGVKIPIFPGVGPDLPEPKPVDYEKMARAMPRTTRQAEVLSKRDFLQGFSTFLDAEMAAAAQEQARQE